MKQNDVVYAQSRAPVFWYLKLPAPEIPAVIGPGDWGWPKNTGYQGGLDGARMACSWSSCV